MSHRLELALKDALQKTVFKEVDKMLLNLYLLYQKAPKKLRQLKELAQFSNEVDADADAEDCSLQGGSNQNGHQVAKRSTRFNWKHF